ncbi:sugar transferase [Actinacidiphila bryophytorum]|uniref:sugar transferase n=1 Tax=Actinacidiphila bryophytorum TaxID=1436133 RepID=UPI0020412E00|nr:sugar transferase [Actinacidiphila bryophytorum]
MDALGAGVPAAVTLHAGGQPHALLAALAAALAWPAVRAVRGRYAAGALGEGRGSLQVLGDWLVLLGVLAVLRTAFGEVTEPSVALAGLVWAPLLTAVCRKATYYHLIAARREAHAVRRVLVIGEPGAADHVVGHLAARTEHAYVVVGVVPVGSAKLECGAPVTERLGVLEPAAPQDDAAAVLRAAREHSAELVLVAPGPRLSAERLRHLSWSLHDAGLPVALLPGLVDVQVRRIGLDAPAGLLVLHIAPPVRRGVQMGVKAALDRTGAALGLLLLAPVFCVVALAIRLTSPGPAFHRQVRCGQHRSPFTMWKFRTMVADAESRKAELEHAGANEHDGLMFKMRRDPRVTAIGRLLRRCSLDELPQLLNVLRGEMSLVGPRPPLPEEVEHYDEVALRRLAVKPGLTGLWQVSGRSDLSWDETLALDLRYVDNWSLAGDLEVMTRTVRAVVDGRGAY